ncbi:MAG: heme exporter protein CcmB [Anaerolineaceae bacterium]|nr:heme exporter protein CcmB [Anaerolineaceae bacterium]
MKTPFLKAVLSIVRKDLRTELRSRELISSMALFALLSILIFSFALELDRLARQEAISGVLWVTVVFASFLGLNRSLAMERDQGNLDAMLIAPIARTTIFFGKLVGNFIFTITVGLVLLPIMTVLYNVSLVQPLVLAVLFMGTFGFTTVGTLLATMTVQTRARENLLPIVMMPLALPLLLAAVKASTNLLTDSATEDWIAWTQILAMVDVVYLVMCYLLFEYVIEE